MRSTSNTTTVTLSADTPAPQAFADTNIANFIASDDAPDVNNNRKISDIQPLIVSYNWTGGEYAPAFRMNATNADVNAAVKITPSIRGTWTMRGPNVLGFIPDADWPADTKFTVKIAKSLTNDDVRPNTYTASFTTPEITASVDSFDIYPDAATPQSVIGVAIISFNYPIDTRNFADKVSVKLDGRNLDFTVKFDRFHRTAFITSAPVEIGARAQIMRLKLNRISAASGTGATKKITANTTIAAADNFFKIVNISTTAADVNDTIARQLVLLNMTADASADTKWSEFIDVYLLPRHNATDRDTSHKWQNDEITDAVLAKSKKLNISPVDFVNPAGVHQYAFEYDVSDKNPRYIYVRVAPGIKSRTGFVLKNGGYAVMRVPYPEKVVKIAGSGALLAIGGDRNLGIMARGGADAAYINLYKVKSTEINHLISQTYNIFASDIEFKSWSFGAYDMSVVFQKKISFADSSQKKTNYASVDLGDYLDRTGADKTGIFIVQAAPTQAESNYSDKRLILLTDLGIIRKINLDQSSTVFVSNLSSGAPTADVEISVLGRNGNAIWAGRTDTDGHAEIPKLAWAEYKNEKEPVAIVARRGSDVSFIPYNSTGDTYVEYSKFDVDGTYTSNSVPLNAFIFSDRGIYRPGEEAVIAGIVKNRKFKSLAGVPVKLEITDARGRTTREEIFSLAADGMFDIKFAIPENAPIGEYSVRLYSLNSKNRARDMLGTAYFRIEEFTPDNMKIAVQIPDAQSDGWIAPDALTATVSLQNLFGTPAANRTIKATAVLRPLDFTFPQYKDYIFATNFIAGTGLAENTFRTSQTFTANIDDAQTDDAGMATLPIKFGTDQISGTYLLNLTVRGLDGAAASGVMTTITARVSDAKYLVGYRTNSNLAYINRGTAHNVQFIAVDHTGAPLAANGLTLRLTKREQLTSLIKDYNDYYKYQTVTRDKIISENPFDVPQDGASITLDTTSGGTYFIQVIDASGKILANIEYFVAADDNASMQTDTQAKMQIKLNAAEYAPGDTIAVSITAPYAGAGLITIERDKVYAYKWFRTNATSSVQHITVPAGFEGTGYVNVSFQRDINSRDVFTSPYTYAVAPMRADIRRREIDITLTAPDVIRDNRLTVKYKTNKNARIMIFAVNAGILQVAKYKLPNPLSHFFQKSALQVETYQILSLLLPEYKILREFAKTGGGDYDSGLDEMSGPLINPFARKMNQPVAFYSGILQATANHAETITFDIPEYFNGAIKIFAVAANNSAIGAADIQTKVQSPLIMTTAAPVAVAPGDKFNVRTSITNMTPQSGIDATVTINAATSENLNISSGAATTTMALPENAEKMWAFDVGASDRLGNATIKLNAILDNQDRRQIANRTASATMSVRPTTTFTTDIKSGTITNQTTIKNFHIDLYPEFASRTLFVSRSASILARPLFEYLNHYDYPCTEQLVSRMLPYAAAPADVILGTTFDASADKIANAIGILKNRQNVDGSFDLWAAQSQTRNNESNANSAYVTAYVAQFLKLATDSGFAVPQDMNSRAIDFLRTYAGTKINNDFDAAAHAFAIYVITQNGYVTTGYIDLFEEYANKNIKNWAEKLMGAYIAASYKMLKQDDKAAGLIAKYRTAGTNKFVCESEFDNNVANDAIFMYLRNKYFDAVDFTPNDLITTYIDNGDYSSYTSAMLIMGLAGNTRSRDVIAPDITVTANDYDISTAVNTGTVSAKIPTQSKTIRIQCTNCAANTPAYYALLQQGYPLQPRHASNGIEITREYYNAAGQRIDNHAAIGDMLTVKIYARSRRGDQIANAVITDLLPGGFVASDLNGNVSFSEIREDRVLIYTDIPRSGIEITYTAQPTAAGTFQIPPVRAASMYNPQINATGTTGQIFVVSDDTPE